MSSLAHQNNKEVFNKYYFLDEKGSGENNVCNGVLVSITYILCNRSTNRKKN